MKINGQKFADAKVLTDAFTDLPVILVQNWSLKKQLVVIIFDNTLQIK